MSKTTSEPKLKKLSKAKSAVGGTKTVVEEVAKKIAPRKAKAKVEKIVSETKAEETSTPVVKNETETKPVVAKHGKKYLAARKKYDINKLYPLKQAIELVKSTSLSKFDGKVEAHLLVTTDGNLGEITFPHLETGAKKIVILNDAVLAQIKEGKVDFDIIIATPVTMPKLLPFARVLGPKGLMPNPKNGTLTDKPEEAVKKLSVAKTMIKTEKKAPVVHQVVGKVSQPTEELVANIDQLIKVVTTQKIKKLVLCATMGPGIKVEVK